MCIRDSYKGLPIVMKDIRDDALALGMNEAGKLLAKQVEKGRMTPAKMSETLGRIRPTLNYGDFGNVDIIIEAVVENPKVKKAVFAEVEGLESVTVPIGRVPQFHEGAGSIGETDPLGAQVLVVGRAAARRRWPLARLRVGVAEDSSASERR